jgi:hypothetical protein
MNTVTIPSIESVICNLKGRNGLRASKPKTNGFDQYVWRMVRYHAGIDRCMPITCDWDLTDYVESFVGKRPTYGTPERELYTSIVNDVRKIADNYVDKVSQHYQLDSYTMARIWKQAGLI